MPGCLGFRRLSLLIRYVRYWSEETETHRVRPSRPGPMRPTASASSRRRAISRFSTTLPDRHTTAVTATTALVRALASCSFSVAQKMSWAAARRQTTRPEDEPCSLLALFGVNMPMLYGEGRQAFLWLQTGDAEVLQRPVDSGPLLTSRTPWGHCERGTVPLRADSPACFAGSGDVELPGINAPVWPGERCSLGMGCRGDA